MRRAVTLAFRRGLWPSNPPPPWCGRCLVRPASVRTASRPPRRSDCRIQGFHAMASNGNAPDFANAGPRHVPSTWCFPLDQPVVALDAKTAFEGLTEREKLYAHHLSRASFYGGLIVLLQTSYESPQIYRLIQKINAAEDVEALKKAATSQDDISVEDFQAFMVYCSGN